MEYESLLHIVLHENIIFHEINNCRAAQCFSSFCFAEATTEAIKCDIFEKYSQDTGLLSPRLWLQEHEALKQLVSIQGPASSSSGKQSKISASRITTSGST